MSTTRHPNVADRHVIVVDTETTGLRPWPVDYAVEVAWWDLTTGERSSFVPRHDVASVLDMAEPRALEINGYRKRLADAAQDDGAEVDRLHDALLGNVIVGSNVRRDAEIVYGLLSEYAPEGGRGFREPWHYHLGELGSYAAGVLGMSLLDPPGLSWCCELLGIEPEGDVHTAEAGVTTTALVLRELFRRSRRPLGDGLYWPVADALPTWRLS